MKPLDQENVVFMARATEAMTAHSLISAQHGLMNDRLAEARRQYDSKCRDCRDAFVHSVMAIIETSDARLDELEHALDDQDDDD